MNSKLIGRRIHTDTGALSLLITNYLFSLITLLIIEKYQVNITRLTL
ncbi:MAG: hypothetical protein ACP5GZ_05930 [Vulcanisaeta sp.]